MTSPDREVERRRSAGQARGLASDGIVQRRFIVSATGIATIAFGRIIASAWLSR